MGYILILISWVLRTYGAVQEQREPTETPLAFQGDMVKTVLMFLWIVLLAAGSYSIFSTDGLVMLLVTLFVYFVIAPTLLGKFFKS